MMEPELCVCGHGADHHAYNGQKIGDSECLHGLDEAVECYCPRFIPRPPPPGTLPNEGKKPSLR